MNKVADSGQQSGDKTVDTGQRTLDNENNEEQVKKLLRTADSGQCESFEMYKIKAEMLQSQLEQSQKQIEQMEKNIDSLNYDKEQLYKQIDTLSTALTTAQALQGIEKKQNLLVVGADAEEQPQQKQGFFARLFRRTSR